MSTAILQESLLADEVAGLARAYAESQAFVSLLAHELRTRLKVTERALSSAGEGGFDTALENTRTVQELVETLLELARGQAVDSADRTRPAACSKSREDVELPQTDIVAGKLPSSPCRRHYLRPSSTTSLQTRSKRALDRRVFARPDGTICVSDDGPASRPSGRPRSSGSTPTVRRRGLANAVPRDPAPAVATSGSSCPRPSHFAPPRDSRPRHRRPHRPSQGRRRLLEREEDMTVVRAATADDAVIKARADAGRRPLDVVMPRKRLRRPARAAESRSRGARDHALDANESERDPAGAGLRRSRLPLQAVLRHRLARRHPPGGCRLALRQSRAGQ